jgi:hypothetical protein
VKPKATDFYATLQKSVRVGHCDFAFEMMTPREATAADQFGHCDYENLAIRLAPGQPSQQLANTVVHEIGHAILRLFGVADNAPEEEYVTNGANGWCGVIRDNPELMKWLSAALNYRAPAGE